MSHKKIFEFPARRSTRKDALWGADGLKIIRFAHCVSLASLTLALNVNGRVEAHRAADSLKIQDLRFRITWHVELEDPLRVGVGGNQPFGILHTAG